MLETLDYTIRIGSTPTILYLYLIFIFLHGADKLDAKIIIEKKAFLGSAGVLFYHSDPYFQIF